MKTTKKLLALLLLLFLAANAYGKSIAVSNIQGDSVNVRMYFSLFYEDFKNKSYKTCLDPAWVVINNNPSPFLKNNIFKKVEDALMNLHDDANTPENEKKIYADTLLYMYDKAIQYDKTRAPYFKMRKAFILQSWYQATPDKFIPLYEDAFDNDSSLPSFYKDRLGLAYMQNIKEDNDYQLKAIELYNNLQELEPNVDTWNQRLASLSGGDISKLVDIKKKSWDLNKDNLEKAWDYANTCIRAKEFEKSIEPLRFLIEKSPNVLNYWKQLAVAEHKLSRSDKAIEAYKKIMELDPNFKDAYVNIALVYKEMKQYSVARTYLYKAISIDEEWDYPVFVEGQLYEDAARNCSGGKLDFKDKVVFQLAVDTYNKAARMNGSFSNQASARAAAFSTSVPPQEDYFFRGFKKGAEIRINEGCYSWIGKSIIAR